MNNIIEISYNKDKYKFSYDFLISLINAGWEGKWKQNINNIQIFNSYNLTLDEYLNKYDNLDYESCLRLIICIGIQIYILKINNLGMVYLSLNDIIVIDDKWFIINPESQNIYNINKDKNITINYPISLGCYIGPELKNMKSLPYNIYYTSAYYSLALICIYSLNLNKQNPSEERTSTDYKKLINSQLYFILERCLEEDPKERIFMII